jgi:GntR family transcriptional regulator / MocR family aminotransferase
MTNSDPQEWSNRGVDLFLNLLPGEHSRGLRVRIEDGLRDAIRGGRLVRGTRLPPTRALARDLGVARRTVVEAYSQLAAEGWIAGRRGSGTVVAFGATPPIDAGSIRERQRVRWRFDLRPGRPDPSSFPRQEWLRAVRQALTNAPDEAFGVGDPAGELALRAELAAYLNRARGLTIGASDLLISTGFTQGLGLVARALATIDRRRRITIEEPSMPHHRDVIREAGHELALVRVDRGGADVEQLEQAGEAAAVVVTPNRQHPTGVALSSGRRARLLEWARATGAYVVEDDYDGEFRYEGRPIGPLQGLDPRHVVYAGTASKTLAPGIRLGWLAMPEPLRAALTREKELADWHTSALEQLAFAELLRSGMYDRHIRKMRLRYRRRRDALLHAIVDADLGVEVMGTAAGLNLLILLPDAETEDRVLAATRAAGVGAAA